MEERAIQKELKKINKQLKNLSVNIGYLIHKITEPREPIEVNDLGNLSKELNLPSQEKKELFYV